MSDPLRGYKMHSTPLTNLRSIYLSGGRRGGRGISGRLSYYPSVAKSNRLSSSKSHLWLLHTSENRTTLTDIRESIHSTLKALYAKTKHVQSIAVATLTGIEKNNLQNFIDSNPEKKVLTLVMAAEQKAQTVPYIQFYQALEQAAA